MQGDFAGMKLAIPNLFNTRTRLWLLLCLLVVTTSLITRMALLLKSYQQIDFTALDLAGVFFLGFIYDLVSAIYFCIPFALYLWLVPTQVFNKKWHRHVLTGWFFIFTTVLIFNGVAEWLFWDEFSSRFNFIAVDYLVYTTEVIGNINQSYPMGWILAGVVIFGMLATIGLKPLLDNHDEHVPFRQRSMLILFYGVITVGVSLGMSSRYHHFSNNAFTNELAGNGLYELFAAYKNNELDYDRFYMGMSDAEAFDLFHKMAGRPDEAWVSENTFDIQRTINNPGPEKKLNVVLISVESFSADFMTMFGNVKHLTPFLDSLAPHSLVFTNLYATGTRTVRGLEALSLCVPPTPGQSIVRRPNNEQLFSLGKVFHDKGYSCEYIYGGYGYFDNMNYFFGNNDYDVIDRTALEDKDVHYENIWGVADEDLFTLAEHRLDQAKGHPIFAHVMTTSNHRPFTYPDGRIDIPSHTGRDGGVKYTDYAIGTFIKKVSKKDWFQNTIFIIVADHCASSAGKTELPVSKYHIPMLIYSPGNVQPGVMKRLMSQIDIGPTLLGMLNFTYTSKFFGHDMYKLEAGKERAFIST
jgi:phosphoglycerol transferase MdoB-like AlkP superfamily enzyme